MAVSPRSDLATPYYILTLPPDEAEWVIIPEAEEATEASDQPPPLEDATPPTDPSWAAFCAGSPRPLVIVDDVKPSAAAPDARQVESQESISSPTASALPVSPVVVVKPSTPRYLAPPRSVDLWNGRSRRAQGVSSLQREPKRPRPYRPIAPSQAAHQK